MRNCKIVYVMDVFWMSYVRSLYVLVPGGKFRHYLTRYIKNSKNAREGVRLQIRKYLVLYNIWEKVFKNELSKFCGIQPLKNCKGRSIPWNFSDCLPQNLLSPLLNTLSHFLVMVGNWGLLMIKEKSFVYRSRIHKKFIVTSYLNLNVYGFSKSALEPMHS